MGLRSFLSGAFLSKHLINMLCNKIAAICALMVAESLIKLRENY